MDTFMCETDSDEDDEEDFASDGDIEKKILERFSNYARFGKCQNLGSLTHYSLRM